MQLGYALCIPVSSISWINLKLDAVMDLILVLIQGPELYICQLHCSPLKDSMLCNIGSGNVLQPMCNAWLGLQIWGQIIQFAWNQMTSPTGEGGKKKKKVSPWLLWRQQLTLYVLYSWHQRFLYVYISKYLIRTGSCLAPLLLSPWTSTGRCGWVAGLYNPGQHQPIHNCSTMNVYGLGMN